MAEQSKPHKGKKVEPEKLPARPASELMNNAASVTSKDPGRDLSGTTIGDFQLLRKLGSGGMGEVYLAQQTSLKRTVALKVLRESLMADETARKRFAVEAEAAAKLTHANIVQIYAFEPHEGMSYMALEYVHGMNLRDHIAKKGPASPRFALKIMEQVAGALHHAAEAGIVHRDIKPDNILLTKRGEVKVADFGLARLRIGKSTNLTQTGVTMGTPLYMSPEQVEDKPLDSRSDLYSFGVTCYFMLTGQPPYRGETALAIAVQHIKGEPEPLEKIRPELPADLCRIVQKLMAKDPDNRHQTGRQVLKDIHKLKADLINQDNEESAQETPKQVEATVPIAEPQRDGIFKRVFRIETMRRFAVWWFAASLLLGLASGGGYGWFVRAPELRPRPGELPQAPPLVDWGAVPKETSAERQYRYASLATFSGQNANTEAEWLAVINYWPNEPDWVLRAQMQLGKYFLDEHQLDKADRHFGEMTLSPDSKTQRAGEVGKAAVLSLRDLPGESQTVLWNAVNDSGLVANSRSFTDRMILGMVLWTLERNLRNSGRDWGEYPEIRAWANRQLREANAPPGTRPSDGPPPRPPGRSPDG